MKFGLIVFMLGLCGLLVAQTAPGGKRPKQGSPGTSNANAAAADVVERIKVGIAARAGLSPEQDVLSSSSRHFILLLDTSQNSHNEVYGVFLRAFSEAFLNDLGIGQKKVNQELRVRGAKPVDLHQVSVFTYQLDLENRKEYTSKLEPLTKQKVQEIAQKIPLETIKQGDYTGYGHDSSGARAKLIERLKNVKDALGREPIIIQVTSMTKNQDPDHPANDTDIRSVDAARGKLEGTAFTPLGPISDKKYITDPGGDSGGASDVYVWLYGVDKYRGVGLPVAQKRTGLPIWAWLVPLFVVVGLIAGFIIRPVSAIVSVSSDGVLPSSSQIRSGQPLTLCIGTPTDSVDRRLSIPTELNGSMPVPSELADIHLSRFKGIKIVARPGTSMSINQVDSLEGSLALNEMFIFKTPDSHSQTREMKFSVS